MARKDRVWVIDDDRSIRWVLERALQRDNMSVDTFESGDKALDALSEFDRQVAIRRRELVEEFDIDESAAATEKSEKEDGKPAEADGVVKDPAKRYVSE